MPILADDSAADRGAFSRRRMLFSAALLLAVTAYALALRLPGYDGRPLWIDELWRADLILGDSLFQGYLQHPSAEIAVTSPVYAAFMRAIALFGTTPEQLRLTSLLPGVAAVVMAFLLVLRAGGGLLLAALGGLLFASNVQFVRYSTELKPFMFEVLVHLCCVYAWLGVVLEDKVDGRRWISFFAVLTLAVLSSPSIVIVLPAMGISVLLSVRARGRAEIVRVGGGFLFLAAIVLTIYVLVWSHGAGLARIPDWVSGFQGAGDPSYWTFIGARLAGLWSGAIHLVGGIFPAYLAPLGIAALALMVVSRRRRESRLGVQCLVFYGVFLATLLLMNYVKLWPLGSLRVNQFIFAHVLILLMLVLRMFDNRLVTNGVALAVLAILGVALAGRGFIAYGPTLEQSDLVWQAFAKGGAAADLVAAHCKGGATNIYLNSGMSLAIKYYRAYGGTKYEKSSVLLGDCVKLNYLTDADMQNGESLRRSIANQGGMNGESWFLYSHIGAPGIELLTSVAKDAGLPGDRAVFQGAGYFRVIASARPKS